MVIHAGGVLRLGDTHSHPRQHPNNLASEQLESDYPFTEFEPCSPKDEQGFFVLPPA